MKVGFELLRNSYPTMKREQLFKELGGEWPTLIGNDNYANTCAIRLSVALRKTGVAIPDKYKEAIDGNKAALIITVKRMGAFLTELHGNPTWGMSKIVGKDIQLPVLKGIIVYHVDWSDATGHFDLWTGGGFVGSGSKEQVKDGYSVAIWSLP